ncbi:MAG TPA: hypothetical protein VFH23_17830 [Jiangellaceae bacterium]|nr:hypothetical protein [Jiangellaceae bacterium]
MRRALHPRLQQRSHPIDGLYLGDGTSTQGSQTAWVAALVRTEVGAAADASDEVGALEGVISAEAITGP